MVVDLGAEQVTCVSAALLLLRQAMAAPPAHFSKLAQLIFLHGTRSPLLQSLVCSELSCLLGAGSTREGGGRAALQVPEPGNITYASARYISSFPRLFQNSFYHTICLIRLPRECCNVQADKRLHGRISQGTQGHHMQEYPLRI